MNAEKQDKLQQVVALFDQAENVLKEVEKICGDLSVPSINELRYVGYHIARGIVAHNDKAFFSEIKKAENHCKRAIYDAYEVGILYFLDEIKCFKKNNENRSKAVCQVLSDYMGCLKASDEAVIKITEIERDCKDSRERYYQEIQPYYQSLYDIQKKFTYAEPTIQNIEYQTQQAIAEKDNKNFIKQVKLATVSVLVGAVIGAGLSMI